ncbi:MAG: flippase-like domain-containing protein [Pirellulales bacterium]|nr:flippase-like domain-containing protein [Pirellulales bacterium]
MRPPRGVRATGRAWVAAALRLAASAVLLSGLWMVLPRQRLVAALAGVPWAAWAAAVPAFLLLHLLGAWKWRWTANLAGSGLQLRDAVRCYYAGLFGNTLLPSIVGGDVLRAALAWRRVRSPAGLVLGSLADRMLDVLALAVLAAGGGVLAASEAGTATPLVFGSLLAGGLAAALVLGAGLWLFRFRKLSWRWRRKLALARRAGRLLYQQRARLLVSLAACTMLQMGLMGLNLWLASFCGLRAAWRVWLFAWPLGKLAAMVPVTQGGIGIREAALAGLLRPFGVPAALAVAASLVFEGVIILGSLAGGLLAVWLGRWGSPCVAQHGVAAVPGVRATAWEAPHAG